MVDDDEVRIEVEEVSGKKDDECATKSKKGDATLTKEDEPNMDFKHFIFLNGI